MAMYKIVFTDYYYPNNETEIQILRQLGDVEIVDCTKIEIGGVKDDHKLIPYVHDADALIVQFAAMTKSLIEKLNKCRIIARYAIGVDNIDVAAAKSKGITVSNVPDYCIEEVSDTAIAHMFNCIRKVSLANMLLYKNEWSYDRIKPIHRISAQTVGLIAFGNIARRTAEKLRTFGVRLLVHDPYFTDKKQYDWIQFVPLKDLLSQADVVSIHCPLTAETHHLMDSEKFDWMKHGAILVNSSRGGLIDETALLSALKNNIIAMAGLDVLDCQDAEYAQSALLSFPDRVVITPHMGWYSEEAIADLQSKTARNVYEMLKHGKPLYEV